VVATVDPYGVLVSKLSYPVTINLAGGVQLHLSARATTNRIKKSQLVEALPAGVVFVPYSR
jgi:hypothetical protein